MKDTLKDRVTRPLLKSGEYVHNNVEISVGHSIGTAVDSVVRLGV